MNNAIYKVRSFSDKEKFYFMKVDKKTGVANECNCPAFLFRNKVKRNCKHIDKFNELREAAESELKNG